MDGNLQILDPMNLKLSGSFSIKRFFLILGSLLILVGAVYAKPIQGGKMSGILPKQSLVIVLSLSDDLTQPKKAVG